MSYDVLVFATEALSSDGLVDRIGAVEALSFSPGTSEVLRTLRGKPVHLASLDGPHRVEPEDLPAAVRAAAPGIATLVELHCPSSPASGVALTKRAARALAEAASGVVYDPQEDRVVWPRGSARKFTAPKEKRIEVVDLTWYIRREDAPVDLPEVVFDSIEALLPEARPRRFGTYEPLQHRLDEEGREGFVREWRGSRGHLFWSPAKPFLSGSTFRLCAPDFGEPPPIPIGTVSLSLHRTALSDGRWRRDVRRLFLSLIAKTNACFALADVERNVGYGGGSTWYGREAETNPNLSSGSWHGLPPHEYWMAWFGPFYRGLVADAVHAHPDVEEVHGSFLVRTSQEPGDADAHFPDLPSELVIPFTSMERWYAGERERAPRVPDGL